MLIKRKVGPKGQIVIPRDVREQLKIQPGSDIYIEILPTEIRIYPATNAETYLETFCRTTRKIDRDLKLKEIYDEQYHRT
ncbi:MAG: hypothetical protein RBG13Loki_1424 [Promethearchaeota archaeon CR_4]|nr:MAG: hypothetical protein RBG13Loki_1424 [Candidatus Lokiarchaeota archaeon CR_4]